MPTATLAVTPAVPPAFVAIADDEPSPANAGSRPMFDGAPTCSECGMLMTPNGACYKCENCGGTSGCS